MDISRRKLLIGAAANSLWVPAAPAYIHGIPNLVEGFVAARARTLGDVDSSFKQCMCRTALIATENLTSIKAVISNFQMPLFSPGAASVVTATFEYNGSSTRITFGGGNASVSIAGGSVATSDYITVNIPAGATFWYREYRTNTAAILYNAWNSTTLSESCSVAVSGLSNQTASTGAITGGTAKTFSVPPMAVIGFTRNKSVLVLGDSRAQGVGDGTGTDHDGRVGDVCRSLGNTPFVNISYPALPAQTWLANMTAADTLLPYGTDLIVELGINDLNPGTYNQTPAQTAASVAGILAAGSQLRKWVTTLEPSTTSSDGWITLVNQATNTPNQIPYNVLVRAGIAGATGYFDIASVMESSVGSGLWRVSPTPPYTGDGAHETVSGYTLLQNSGVVHV